MKNKRGSLKNTTSIRGVYSPNDFGEWPAPMLRKWLCLFPYFVDRFGRRNVAAQRVCISLRPLGLLGHSYEDVENHAIHLFGVDDDLGNLTFAKGRRQLVPRRSGCAGAAAVFFSMRRCCCGFKDEMLSIACQERPEVVFQHVAV